MMISPILPNLLRYVPPETQSSVKGAKKKKKDACRPAHIGPYPDTFRLTIGLSACITRLDTHACIPAVAAAIRYCCRCRCCLC